MMRRSLPIAARLPAASATRRHVLAATAAKFSTSTATKQASEAPKQPKMVKLTINGKEIEVEQG